MVFIGNAVVPGSSPPPTASPTAPWTLIDSVTVAASGDNVDFTAIPGTFRHLMMLGRLVGFDSDGDDFMGLQMNGETGAAYDGWWMIPSGGAAVSDQYLGATSLVMGDVLGSADPQYPVAPGDFAVWFLNYASALWLPSMFGTSGTYHRGQTFGGSYTGAGGAITSLHILDQTGGTGFVAGGVVDLYGI